MWLALFLGWVIGIACMGQVSWSLHSSFYALLVLNLLWCFAIYRWFLYVSHAMTRSVIALFTAVLRFACGLSYADRSLQQRLAFKVQKTEQVEVLVYIDQINTLTPKSVQQRLKVLNHGTSQQLITWLTRQPREGLTAEHQFKLGQFYLLQGELRPIRGYANPGGFYTEKWALQQDLSAQFKIQQLKALSKLDSAHPHSTRVRAQQGMWQALKLKIETSRLNLREFIQQQPIQHKGLVLALLTGDESLLTPETEQLFQRFGISHLLAISGPHVLVFAAIFCWLLKSLIERYRPEWYLKFPRQYLLLFPFNLCVLWYCSFVGFEIPAVRTLLMTLTISVLLICRIKLSNLKMLLISASLLLWIDPFSVLSAAFWLSYGACFILLRIYETMQQQTLTQVENWRQRYWMAFKLLQESQWKIFIALLPLMLIFFQQISWIAPISNLIAIPWIGLLIVPLDIVAVMLFFLIPPLASLVFQFNDLCIQLLLLTLNGLDHVLEPALHRIAFDALEISCLIAALVIIFLPRGVLPKYWALLCLIPLLFPNEQRHSFEIHILDVGQGQAIFVREAERSMLIDVGGSFDETEFSVAERILLPFLSAQSVSQLDAVWLSHLDQDHSGALPKLMSKIAIQNIIANERPEEIGQSSFRYCQQGAQEQWSKHLKIEVLSPLATQLAYAQHQRNETSCVLLLTIQQDQAQQQILIMGDAGWPTEFRLLEQYPDLKADILLLGHHGSRHSSAYAFLQHVQPKIAIASAGAHNRYGHPSEQVKARLQHLNIPLLQTAHTGTIQFRMNEGQLQLKLYRRQYPWLQTDVSCAAVWRNC